MKYELAAQLRDAGFPMTKSVFIAGMGMTIGNLPFNEKGYLTCESIDPPRIGDRDKVGVECYPVAPNPTLSELIEACGEDFDALIRVNEKQWNAHAKRKLFDGSDGRIAELPKEAVAKLYLSINA
jgi:hypothetical protein